MGALARDGPDPWTIGPGTAGVVVEGAGGSQEEGAGNRMGARGRLVAEVGEDLKDLLGEVARVGGSAAQRGGRAPVRARGASQPQIDSAGVEGGQGADLLGDDERAWLGSMIPPEATPRRSVAARTCPMRTMVAEDK